MYRLKAKLIAGVLFVLIFVPTLYVTSEIFRLRANELQEIPPPPPPLPEVKPEPTRPDLYVAPAPIRYPFY